MAGGGGFSALFSVEKVVSPLSSVVAGRGAKARRWDVEASYLKLTHYYQTGCPEGSPSSPHESKMPFLSLFFFFVSVPFAFICVCLRINRSSTCRKLDSKKARTSRSILRVTSNHLCR